MRTQSSLDKEHNVIMTMKLTPTLPLILLTSSLLAVPWSFAAAQTNQDPIAVARSVLKADRQAAVKDILQLTETESQKFWPLYQQYRAEMDKVGDGLVKLVKEYAGYYPDVPNEQAAKMLKELCSLEKKQVAIRASYLKKSGKILPAAKNLRFAQVENRLDLALRLQLAAEIPLVPIEGKLIPETAGAGAYVAGVPGGVVVRTVELTATVTAIDSASRLVKLVTPDGIKTTVKAGPEVVNFDQIRVGDQLKITAAEQLVVQMAEPGESAGDGTDSLVALAPKGAKPGGLVAQTSQVTAKVTAIDEKNRTATLQFEDGSSRTLPVRSDVDLGKRKVGEQVSFRVTEMIAISVEKP
jgi:hypothetical protein